MKQLRNIGNPVPLVKKKVGASEVCIKEAASTECGNGLEERVDKVSGLLPPKFE